MNYFLQTTNSTMKEENICAAIALFKFSFVKHSVIEKKQNYKYFRSK